MSTAICLKDDLVSDLIDMNLFGKNAFYTVLGPIKKNYFWAYTWEYKGICSLKIHFILIAI